MNVNPFPRNLAMLSRRDAILLPAGLALMVPLPAFAQEADTVDIKELAVTGALPERSMGKADAPVTVVEYASMTCGHCARFHTESLPGIKEKYIDTGKVRYVLREFPLDPRATAGFMLARCAGDDKFFPMVDVLFRQQPAWAHVEAGKVLENLLQIAKQAGFTQQQFEACLQDQKLYDGVNWVKQRGAEVFKIDATPTFFINGKRVSGELSVDAFAKIVDPLLPKTE